MKVETLIVILGIAMTLFIGEVNFFFNYSILDPFRDLNPLAIISLMIFICMFLVLAIKVYKMIKKHEVIERYERKPYIIIVIALYLSLFYFMLQTMLSEVYMTIPKV